MRLGELLVMNGLITQEQLEEVLRDENHTKKKIGELIVERGWITERQLLEALEFQLGFPVVNVSQYQLDERVVQLITEQQAKKYTVIPIERLHGKIKVAMVDPLNYDAIEDIRMSTGMNVMPCIATRAEIEQAIAKYYGMNDSMEELLEDIGDYDVKDEEQEAQDQDSPIVKLVNQIIQSAVLQRASDVHIDPQENHVAVRYRIDGVLRNERQLPKNMHGVLTARLKIISKLNIAEKRLPQDGRIQLRMNNQRVDIRVSILPTVHGESIVLRILDQSIGVKHLHELGLSESNMEKFQKVIRRPNGIILISGPTGSGKTSTLYSVLQEVNSEEVKIITVEDPVEYRMEGVIQVQVNTQIGLTFASGLRSILRQDPNIIMVGEIRDVETAEIAVRSSLTGHLVLSTIHTNSAIGTISRLADMGIDPYLIASSLTCVVGQRLVRRVCSECASQVAADEKEIALLQKYGLIGKQGQAMASTGTEHVHGMSGNVIPSNVYLTKGSGCAVCGNTGYKGRMAVHEVLVIDEPIRRMIVSNAPASEIQQYAEQELGYTTMMVDGLTKSLAGLTTIEEVLKAVSDE